jgi:hypothetical protein
MIKTIAYYTGLLHVELLGILWCGISIADRIVHTKLEQLVDMLEMFTVMRHRRGTA